MQVANNARAIEKYLKERYEDEIETVSTAAQAQAQELTQEYENKAKQLEADILATAKRQAQANKQQEIAQAKTQARTQEQEVLSELAAQVVEQVKNEYMNKHNPQEVLDQLTQNVKESITKRGLDPEDFTFTQNEKELFVQAQTDDLLIEDGLKIRLEDFKQTVIEHVKEEVRK